jgi:hypothetical protein
MQDLRHAADVYSRQIDVLRMPRQVLPVLVDLDSHRLRFHLLQKTNHIRIELPCAEPQPLSSVEFDV